MGMPSPRWSEERGRQLFPELCTRVPQKYCAQGTFVIDVTKVENDSALRKDGNGSWGKPSGCSRYYKLTAHNDVVRIDRGISVPDSTDDIQILSKRYENEGSLGSSFVRKIYTGKNGGSRETQQLCATAVHLIPQIHTKSWEMKEVKQEADGIPPRKVRDNSSNRRHNGGNGAHTMVNENDAAEIRAKVPRVSVRASTIWEGETPSFDNLVLSRADHLKRLALAKEVENQN
ncbi:hypothetical protein Tcan_17505 [Toxocara canis]|uniref:Uncharacterized protein n=1 Tax=Toxocara canis TaxID=6265 RepID=A0A0B2VCB3_TOXCA|nr:hypothetical protein Tcan_17505 [Toxocara canis]